MKGWHSEVNEVLYAAEYVINGEKYQGRVHAIKEGERTFCGTELQYTGGTITPRGYAVITCKSCLRSLDSAERNRRAQVEWEAQAAEWRRKRAAEDAQRAADNALWWSRYNAYLQSPEWARRRQLVFDRAAGLCEGCRLGPPIQVHHRSYEHVGNEFLFELVALCESCHQKAHPDKALESAR